MTKADEKGLFRISLALDPSYPQEEALLEVLRRAESSGSMLRALIRAGKKVQAASGASTAPTAEAAPAPSPTQED